MSKLKKIHDCEWQVIEGILCVVFVGRDELRREVRVAVPAAAIMTTIASDARRRLAARAKLGIHDSTAGAWNQVGFLRANNIELGITVDDKVGLILDPGEETEFALTIEPQLARELGARLVEIADQATVRNSTVN